MEQELKIFLNHEKIIAANRPTIEEIFLPTSEDPTEKIVPELEQLKIFFIIFKYIFQLKIYTF